MDDAVSEAEGANKATERAGWRQGSLYQQVRRARLWLPLAIVGVVVLYQLVVVPLGGPRWQFWSQLLFYSILGPLVTFLTLDWIASEVRQREQAQEELTRLYTELQASHRLLGAIQKVTEQFAAARDLEAVLDAAVRGIAEVTAARGVAVALGSSSLGVNRSYGLDEVLSAHAAERDAALVRGETPLRECTVGGRRYDVLSVPLVWGERIEGSVHAYFERPPTSEQRESFSILVSQVSAAAEAARSRTRDLLTLVDVDRSIRAEGNLERLLDTLLRRIMSRAEAQMGGVYLADELPLLQLRVLRTAADDADARPGAAAGSTVRVGEGFVGRVAELGEPVVRAHLSDDERSGPVLAAAQSAVGLPLRDDEGLLGVVVLAHAEPRHFDEASLRFLGLVAGQVGLAVRNARAYLQSEELAIAEERARIAREIHDGVAQSLAFSALKLDLVSRLLEKDPDKAAAELAVTKATLRDLIKEVRRSIFALRPIDLERHGFVETIRRYVHDFGQQNELAVDLQVGSLPEMTVKSEAVLFRIFQEAMTNVAKHARARRVAVEVGRDGEGQVFVRIEDDGCGFDPATVADRVTTAGGLGLRQMRERVEARGGRFEIASRPGEGTRVYASVPE